MTTCRLSSVGWTSRAVAGLPAFRECLILRMGQRRHECRRCTLKRAPQNTRGSALLTVLWIAAALSAIAFSLATTVRGETERVSTDLDGLRAYYLAAGAVERASIEKMWANWYPDKAKIPKGSGWIMYT